MDTVLRSLTQTVIIGPNRPFVIIGERINPTGRKALAAEMAAGNFSRVIADAKAQVEAGAHVLDVNSGVPLTDEAEISVEGGAIVLRRPASRAGWAEASRRVAEADDDVLVMGEFGNADDTDHTW